MEPVENVLPENFNGTFEFSNPSDEDFVGKWGGMAYPFPAQKTTPMIILNASPLEVQQIRKKFAKELAEREFFKSTKYESMRSLEGAKDENGVIQPRLGSFNQARSYNLGDLENYIQKCLNPLPHARASMRDVPKEKIEDKLTRDDDGELNTTVVRERQPLKLKEKAPRI